MRNEIYSRIRQNKMKYYAELNTSVEKVIPVYITEEKKPEMLIQAAEKPPKGQNALLKKVQEFDYKSMFKKVPQVVKSGYNGTVKSKAITALKTQVKSDHEKIKQYSAKVNQRIDRQTDKLANGVYSMSSFLFEEQNESNGKAEYSNNSLVVESIGNNTIEWNVTDESQAAINVYDKIGELSERTFDFIRSAPAKFKKYLTTDEEMKWNKARLIIRG